MVFRNLLPNDHLKNAKGEVFKVKEKEQRICSCKELRCHVHAPFTKYVLESVNTRKIYEVTQEYINEKFEKNEIVETIYIRGTWK